MVPFQVMYPYTKNTKILIDPMDPCVKSEDQRISDQCQYMGCTLANANATQRAYALGAKRANMGYNFAFFSPWIYKSVTGGEYVGSAAIGASQATAPAHTLMFGTAIWNRTGSGAPTGGGNWVVQTPCWQDANGNLMAPMNNYTSYTGNGMIFSYGSGWDPSPTAAAVFGFLWPFYNTTSTSAAAAAQNGQVVIGWADGHAKAMPISQVAAGCSAYGVGTQQGKVTDASKFIWALNQVRTLAAITLLVALAGFSGGSSQDTQADPAGGNALKDQLSQAAAGNAIRNKPPKGHMPSGGLPRPESGKQDTAGAGSDSAAKKPDASEPKTGARRQEGGLGSGN